MEKSVKVEQGETEGLGSPRARFLGATVLEMATYKGFVARFSRELEKSEVLVEVTRDEIVHKLTAYKPRRSGAVGAYLALSGRSFREITETGSLDIFRLFLYLGDVLDEKLDGTPKETFSGDIHELKQQALLEDDLLVAVYDLLMGEIDRVIKRDTARGYLKRMVDGYINFVVMQEHGVMQLDLRSYNWDYSVKFRESQNLYAGMVCTALLNGDRALEPDYQGLEGILPRFSYLTQFVDDLGDVLGDIRSGGGRPSFVIGALVETGEIDDIVRLQEDGEISGKILPRDFRKIATEAYKLLYKKFEQYAKELEDLVPQAGFLIRYARFAFNVFPYIRNVIHFFPPLRKYAYF